MNGDDRVGCAGNKVGRRFGNQSCISEAQLEALPCSQKSDALEPCFKAEIVVLFGGADPEMFRPHIGLLFHIRIALKQIRGQTAGLTDEGAGETVRRRRIERPRRPDLADFSGIHHRNAVRDRQRFLLIMGDIDDGQSEACAGISLPGGFAPDGKVLLAHEYFPDLDRHALAPAFCEALAMPCNVDTDGACATLGEFLYGAASAYDTFFLLHIGHGVGGGAVINGQLFRGAHGNASKPGVLFPYDTPRPSGQDLVEYLQHNGIDIADIFDLAGLCEDTEPLVENWLDRSAGQIAELGRVITAFIDPEVIFVGGRLPDRFNTALVDRLAGISLPGPSRGLPNAPFKASTLGTNSGVLGAASLPIFARFMTGSQISAGNAYRDGRRPVTG